MVVAIVIQSEISRFFFIRVSLCQADAGDHHVDQLDADKRNDPSPDTVDPQIVAQQNSSTYRTILDSAEGQWNQRNNDQSVKNYGRENRRLRSLQVHDVQ